MLPSRSDRKRVTDEIETLIEEYSFLRLDEKTVALATHGRGTEDGYFFWSELTTDHMIDVLTRGINWQGFDPEQQLDVIQNVIDGKEPFHWMDGIETDDGPHKKGGPPDRFAEREAKARELFDISTRVMFAQYLEENALNLDIALRPAEQVREVWFREAEKTWDSFREECEFRTDEEIAETLAQFKVMEAALGETRTLMDHLRAGGLFVDPDLNPHSNTAGLGDGDGDRPVRPLTRELIECCQLDVWPGNATVVDFGLDSSSHLGALQYAIRERLVTPHELDAAMGKGAKLTEISQRGDNPYRDVVFRTSWDGLMPEPETPPESGGAGFLADRTDGDAAAVADAAPAQDVEPAKVEPNGSYEIWHAKDLFAAGVIGRVMGMPPQNFPEDYERVATVLARDLDQVFALTNHADTSWHDNIGVRMIAAEARSTSDGDVIVDPEGRPHRVEPLGFEPIAQRSDYARMLDEAAEAGKHRTKDKDRGIDR